MRQSVFLIIEKHISSIAIAAFFFYLAYALPEEVLGQYSAIEALALLCTVLTLGALDAVLQNRAITVPSLARDYIWGGLYLKFTFSVVSYGLYLCVAVMLLGYASMPSMLIGSLIIAKAFTIVPAGLVALERFRLFAVAGVSTTVLSLGVKLSLLNLLAAPLNSLVFAVDFLMMGLLYFFVWVCLSRPGSVVRCVVLVLPVLRESLPFVVSSFVLLAYSKVDQIMIARMLSFSDVANYSLVFKIVGAAVLVGNAFVLAYVPDLARSKVKGGAAYLAQIQRLMRHTLVVGFVGSVVCAIVTPFLLEFVYPSKYQDSRTLVVAASPLILLMFVATSVGRIMIVEGWGRIALSRNVAALVVNIVLNLALMPVYGVYGAVMASLSAWLISSVIVVAVSTKTRFIFSAVVR